MTKQKQSLIISFLIGFVILVGLDQWTKGLVVQSSISPKIPFQKAGCSKSLFSKSRSWKLRAPEKLAAWEKRFVLRAKSIDP